MLVGVIHLPPLPGSPRAPLGKGLEKVLEGVRRDALALSRARYDAIIVENFGDAPFFADRVPPVTVSAMTLCVAAANEAASGVPIGVNVLRNDAESALSIAAVTGSAFIRVNIHSGARVTDQGTIQSRAAETLRLRSGLGVKDVAIWADVDVKHSSPLGTTTRESVLQETHDVVERGLASAVLVTGDGTGVAPDESKLAGIKKAAGRAKVFIASGATVENMASFAAHADGIIVGSALRRGGKAGGPVDPARAKAFASAYRSTFRR
ncbi:MAG: BtpA/SgcQ family protein [Polyangiaceae bacterium]